MPPFRRRFSRRSFKKRRFARKFGRGLAPRRTGGFFGIRRMTLKAESKVVDTNIATNPTTTAFIQIVNGIAAGTAFNERIGRKIRIKSIALRFAGQINQTTPTPFVMRLMLVMDKQANGSTPLYSDFIISALLWRGSN